MVNHLLYKIADAEAQKPESEAVQAAIALFRAVAETERRRRGDDRQFIELSVPREVECRHEFQCEGWTVDPKTSVCRVCGKPFIFFSTVCDPMKW